MAKRNPITVGGLSKTIKKNVDALLDASARAVKQAKQEATAVDFDGSVVHKLRGKYAFDEDRELGLVGNLLVKPSASIAEVTGESGADFGADSDSTWNSEGDGDVEISFSVAIRVREITSPPE